MRQAATIRRAACLAPSGRAAVHAHAGQIALDVARRLPQPLLVLHHRDPDEPFAVLAIPHAGGHRDFGLGQAEAGVLPGLPHLSRSRFNAWTPGYAAPELLEQGTLSAAADVYAVACLIYELASGRHPYRRLPSTQARTEQLERTLSRPPNRCPRPPARMPSVIASRAITGP